MHHLLSKCYKWVIFLFDLISIRNHQYYRCHHANDSMTFQDIKRKKEDEPAYGLAEIIRMMQQVVGQGASLYLLNGCVYGDGTSVELSLEESARSFPIIVLSSQ